MKRLVFLLLLGLARPVPAAGDVRASEADTDRPPSVGVVDASLLFVFHPAMRNFVREENAFTAPFPASMTSVERKVLLRQRTDRLEKLYETMRELSNQLAERVHAARKQLQAAQKKLHDGQAALASRRADALAAGQRPRLEVEKEHVQASEVLEAEYWAAVDQTHKTDRDVKDVDAFHFSTRLKLAMLPRGQVLQLVEKIFSDIEVAIEEVRARRDFDLIVNEGYLPLPPVAKPDQRPPLLDPYPENHSTLMIPYRELERLPDVAGLAWRRNRMLQWHVGQGDDLLRHLRGTAVDRLVVSGGEEVTHEALAVLLELHPIASDLKRDLVAFVRAKRGRGAK